MTLSELYTQIDTRLQSLSFDALFANFHRFPFAVYDEDEVCLEGRLIPHEPCFCANTSIEYEGRFTAIWNVAMDPPKDLDRMAGNMVHEMFHCYQQQAGESRYPSDLALLLEPNDSAYYAIKHQENRCLAEAFATGGRAEFDRFVRLRSQRAGMNPTLVAHEQRAETIEGMAEYVGLKALRQLDANKFAAEAARYAATLTGEGPALFDARRLAYFSGALCFLCMDNLGMRVDENFPGQRTPLEQIICEADAPAALVADAPWIQPAYAKLMQEREEAIQGVMRQKPYTACSAYICGYDPMNMFRWQDFIFCKRFVQLQGAAGALTLKGPCVLAMADQSESMVAGYYGEESRG